MATTLNGFIAKKDHDTPWSEEEFQSYHDFVAKTQNMIIGRKTYELMKDAGDLDTMKNIAIAVVTSKTDLTDRENIKFVPTFEEGYEFLKNKNFEEILISGGAALNKAAIDADVIDELFIDIEPYLFGNGIPLVDATEKELKLEYIDSKMLNRHTVQLHYKILK